MNELRAMRVTPLVAENTSGRVSAIDGRKSYALSQLIGKRIEERFGWIKTIS